MIKRTLLLAAGLVVGLGALEAYAVDNQLVVCRTGNGLDCFAVTTASNVACTKAAKSLADELAEWGEVKSWCIDKLSGDVDPVTDNADDK